VRARLRERRRREIASARARASSGNSASAVGSVKPAAHGAPFAIARPVATITAV
jgi:hypothetical protein